MSAITDTIEKIKHFDFSKFTWKEAVAGPDGKSSAGKMIAYFYGFDLIIIALISVIAPIFKAMPAGLANSNLLFVGVQMPIVLGYLFGNKALEIKRETEAKQ